MTGWQVEGNIYFGPNVVSFLIMLGAIQWYVVGTYMPPNDVQTVYCMDQALKSAPEGLEIILMGDLNVRLKYPSDKREE